VRVKRGNEPLAERRRTPGDSREEAVSSDGSPAVGMRASRLLRTRALWVAPAVIASVLVLLMTLFYVGSVVDPQSHLHDLPVLLVDQDEGASLSTKHIDVGREIVSALNRSSVASSRLLMSPVTLVQAKARMNENDGYAAIVIPPGFTRSVLALYGVGKRGLAPPIPTVELLTNGRAGNIGVSLATGVAQPALGVISRGIGKQLLASAAPQRATNASTGMGALRRNPVALSIVAYRPLPLHSALGLSAFYVALLALMCGFLSAPLINSIVDFALGYAASEIGPRWTQRTPVAISRWQTLLAKWSMAVMIAPLLTAIMLLVAIVGLHMNATHVLTLWLFTSVAAVVVAMGTLVLFAALGTLGQLAAILVFVYLGLASSGGTIPLQALPGVLRFTASFEPLRQVIDGVRAILYFNAAGDAGLTRGVVMTGIGLVFWLVLGAAITNWYDRKGLSRIQPEVIAYVSRSVDAYPARTS
jgi:YhgE/Pip-like protein